MEYSVKLLDQQLLDQLGALLGAAVSPALLSLALTHPSVIGEAETSEGEKPESGTRPRESERTQYSNQRLEFLGDAVVGLVAAEYFYRSDPTLPEGLLTQRKAAAVQGRSLAGAARRLDLGHYVRLGRGEAARRGAERDTILSDTFEAVVGALFVEHGLEAARAFVLRVLADELVAVAHQAVNVKNRLQEQTQAVGLGTPVYLTASVGGPAHERRFSAEVLLQNIVRGRGTGKTKKEAECVAATAALAALAKVATKD